MARRIDGVLRAVAVASGKGGVGKTTVAVNLALALALDGARVGIFDADVYGPNVPLMFGVRRRQSASGMLPVGRASRVPYIKPLERYGVKVMSVGLIVGETDAVLPDPRSTGGIVTQTLRDVVWGQLDYLLIDFPPGTGEPHQTLLREVAMDGVVVVTTPQDLSLLDAGRSLGQFRRSNVPVLGLIENMSYLYCPHCGQRVEVFHHTDQGWAVQGAEVELLGRIQMDLAISRGIHSGHPLVQANPAAPEAAPFRQIAAKLVEKLAAA